MSANILFFSNRCEGSQLLISMMQSEGLLKYFTQVCIDNNPSYQNRIMTPTLMIKGIPELYVTTNAFAWFSKVKQARIQNQMQYMAEAQRKCMQNNLSANNNVGPTANSTLLGFNKTEMEGMSDVFAFLSDNASAVPHSQMSYNNIGTNDKIIESRYGNDEEKITKTEQVKYNQSMMSDRQKQDNMFKQQLDTFMNQQYK